MVIYSALLLGLMGSFHCAGMCGPIALATPINRTSWVKILSGGIIYNFGRIITYSLMGVLFGLIGFALNLAGFQKWISIATGSLMIIAIVFTYIFPPRLNVDKGIFSVVAKLKKALGLLLHKNSYSSLFAIGALNGFLPCGLVYIALAGSLASSGILQGALFMLVFGIGTIPMLLIIALAGNLVSIKFRNRLQKAIPYLVVIIGMLFILRGLGLGIPYISPAETRLHPAKQIQLKTDSIPPCCKK